MKIKFKDTLIKENLLTYIMVLCSIAGVITSLLMSPINWTGAVWAFAAAIASVDLVLVDTLRLHEKRDLKQKLRTEKSNLDVLTAMHADDQRKINELTVRVDDLRQQRSDFAAKYEMADAQRRVRENELQELQKKYDDQVQANDVSSAVPTTPPKPKKNPTTGTSRKAKYTKKDVARIHEEMKVGGMIKEKDEE